MGTTRSMGDRRITITITVPVRGNSNITDGRISELKSKILTFIRSLRLLWVSTGTAHVDISYGRHIEDHSYYVA